MQSRTPSSLGHFELHMLCIRIIESSYATSSLRHEFTLACGTSEAAKHEVKGGREWGINI